jgi:hypothetical protein
MGNSGKLESVKFALLFQGVTLCKRLILKLAAALCVQNFTHCLSPRLPVARKFGSLSFDNPLTYPLKSAMK